MRIACFHGTLISGVDSTLGSASSTRWALGARGEDFHSRAAEYRPSSKAYNAPGEEMPAHLAGQLGAGLAHLPDQRRPVCHISGGAAMAQDRPAVCRCTHVIDDQRTGCVPARRRRTASERSGKMISPPSSPARRSPSQSKPAETASKRSPSGSGLQVMRFAGVGMVVGKVPSTSQNSGMTSAPWLPATAGRSRQPSRCGINDTFKGRSVQVVGDALDVVGDTSRSARVRAARSGAGDLADPRVQVGDASPTGSPADHDRSRCSRADCGCR